jgi:hypothetical protein
LFFLLPIIITIIIVLSNLKINIIIGTANHSNF